MRRGNCDSAKEEDGIFIRNDTYADNTMAAAALAVVCGGSVDRVDGAAAACDGE